MSDTTWARYPYRALFDPLGIRRAVIHRDPSGQFIVSTAMHAAAVDWARLGLFLARVFAALELEVPARMAMEVE